MYTKIMVPVDLRHLAELDKALRVAADLASHYGAEVVYVGVTGEEPSDLGATPAEVAGRLEAFAAEQAAAHGVRASATSVVAPDLTADLDAALQRVAAESGADLVVMASHKPGLVDWFWPSHGGRLASHATISVFLVR